MLNSRFYFEKCSVFPAAILWLPHFLMNENLKNYVINYVKEIGKQGLQVALQCHINLYSFKIRNFEEGKMRWIITSPLLFSPQEYWNILDLLTFFDYQSMKKHGHSDGDVKGNSVKSSVHCLSLSFLFSRIYCLQMLTVCSKLMSLVS